MRALVVAAMLLASATAYGRERAGTVVGIGVGPGGLAGDGFAREAGVALELRFGGMLHRRIALVTGASIVSGSSTDLGEWEQRVFFVGARIVVTEVFWLEGGGGGAALETGQHDTDGMALVGGAGVDIMNTRIFSLGVALHGAFSGYDDGERTGTSALTVTLTWY